MFLILQDTLAFCFPSDLAASCMVTKGRVRAESGREHSPPPNTRVRAGPYATPSSLNSSLLTCRRFPPPSSVWASLQGGRQSPWERLPLQNFFLQRAEIPSVNPGEGSGEWPWPPHGPAAHLSRRGRWKLCQAERSRQLPRQPRLSVACEARTGHHAPWVPRPWAGQRPPQSLSGHESFTWDRQTWESGWGVVADP